MNEKLELLKKYYIKAESAKHAADIIEFLLSIGAKDIHETAESKSRCYIVDENYIDAFENEGDAISAKLSLITLEEARKLVEEKTFPRKMYVSDYDPKCGEKHERIVLWENTHGKPKHKFVTVEGRMENDFATGKEYNFNFYRFAKEIEPENTQKQELLNKADELIQKANELKQQAEKL
jgi:hypothetical protein